MRDVPPPPRAIQCVGRRRIVVKANGKNTVIEIWIGDPPHGKRVAGPELEPLELQKLLLALTEVIANGSE
jgi:hypothetical protein